MNKDTKIHFRASLNILNRSALTRVFTSYQFELESSSGINLESVNRCPRRSTPYSRALRTLNSWLPVAQSPSGSFGSDKLDAAAGTLWNDNRNWASHMVGASTELLSDSRNCQIQSLGLGRAKRAGSLGFRCNPDPIVGKVAVGQRHLWLPKYARTESGCVLGSPGGTLRFV